MILRILLGFFALMACGVAAADAPPPAIAVNPDGQGQMLIFPYYTTSAGNSTLLTLNNVLSNPLVLRVRIAEGENGQDVLSFHIYMAAYDTWTGVLFDRGETQTPGLLTEDRTCTVPSLSLGAGLPQLPDGRRYTPLRGGLDDGGSTVPARLREGFIEVLAVAAIGGDTAAALVAPRRCDALQAAWAAPDGYWRRDPLRDLSNTSGYISGQAVVVNAAAGTAFGVNPVALSNFRVAGDSGMSVVVHEPLDGRTAPLSTLALTQPRAGTATAEVHLGASGRQCRLTYPAPQRAADAVSAVLSVFALTAPYEQDASIGARTSYLLTYPTRPLYTNREYTGGDEPIAPYSHMFDGVARPKTPAGFRFRLRDRDGDVTVDVGDEICPFGFCPLQDHVWLPGTAVEVLSPAGSPDALLGSRLNGHIADERGIPLPANGNGIMDLNLANRGDRPVRALRPSLEGVQVWGVPVIATRLTSYGDAGINPGLRASFADTFRVQREIELSPYRACQN